MLAGKFENENPFNPVSCLFSESFEKSVSDEEPMKNRPVEKSLPMKKPDEIRSMKTN
jgi:hypothetical protein